MSNGVDDRLKPHWEPVLYDTTRALAKATLQ